MLITDIEGQRNAEIDYMLELAAQEEKEMRRKLSQDLKRDWDASTKYKKESKDIEKQSDLESAGNAMQFSGLDDLQGERSKAQKEQMLRWTQEARQEAAYKKAKEFDEERAYADMIAAIEEIRDANANQEDDMRKHLNHSIADDNRRVCTCTHDERRIIKLLDYYTCS